jgi:8-oxo-dGTP diphosphatase
MSINIVTRVICKLSAPITSYANLSLLLLARFPRLQPQLARALLLPPLEAEVSNRTRDEDFCYLHQTHARPHISVHTVSTQAEVCIQIGRVDTSTYRTPVPATTESDTPHLTMDPSEDVAMPESLPVQDQEVAQQEDQVIPDAPPADDAPVLVEEGFAEIPVVEAAVKTDDSTVFEGSTFIEGTPSRKKGTEIPPEHRGAIYQRYLNGESMGNIAKAEGLSKSTIQHVVRKVKETGSTQTKPRCGRPLKQGELSRTTLRRRKLKGLMVEAGGPAPSTDNQAPVADMGNGNDPASTVTYSVTGTMAADMTRPVAPPIAPLQFPIPQHNAVPQTVVCSDIYGINHAVPTIDLQWRPAAYAIVVKNSSILLLRQNGGGYDLPGGGVKLGEDPQNAALRELKEETGINASNPSIMGAESSLFRASHSDNKSYHSLLMYYGCTFVSGKISTRGLDANEKLYVEGAEWVKLSTLDTIKVSSTVDFRPYVRKATAKPQ